MMLVMLLAIPLFAGCLCLVSPRALARVVAYAGLLSTLGVAVSIAPSINAAEGIWRMEWKYAWIPSWHVDFYLAVDSFAYWLVLLSIVLSIFAVYISRPTHGVNNYFACILWAIFGVNGLFLSADAFLFFIFWELALLPIYWILIVHGEKMAQKQTMRFIILTQASGVILLASVIGFAYLNEIYSGIFTFDYVALVDNELPAEVQRWLLLGFLLAFLIKLPSLPFHGWMPSLFSEGPAAAVLVAILVKTAIFGLIRFSWATFPLACAEFAFVLMVLGVATMLYGAVLAFGQTDPKRILAYGTLSHAGLLLVGVFCQSSAGFFGVLFLLTASALSTGALLMLLDRRSAGGEVDLSTLTGLWQKSPRFSVMILLFALASMGFPLFGNFIGEWFILWATFVEQPLVAITLSLGVVLSAAYSLRLFQRLCLGVSPSKEIARDLSLSEMGLYAVVAVLILGLGLSPAMVFEQIEPPFAQAFELPSGQELSLASTPRVVSP